MNWKTQPTLKEEVYQAVHDYVKHRVDELTEQEEFNALDDYQRRGVVLRLTELLKVQNLIYKMFADYNEKLAQEETK